MRYLDDGQITFICLPLAMRIRLHVNPGVTNLGVRITPVSNEKLFHDLGKIVVSRGCIPLSLSCYNSLNNIFA